MGNPWPRLKEVRDVLHLSYVLAKGSEISVSLRIPGILAILAGILILLFPKLLNYVVAAYLIFVGVVQVFNIHSCRYRNRSTSRGVWNVTPSVIQMNRMPLPGRRLAAYGTISPKAKKGSGTWSTISRWSKSVQADRWGFSRYRRGLTMIR